MAEPSKFSSRCVECGKEFAGDEIICPVDGGMIIAGKKDPAIGTIVAEKYEIQDVLGGGGMGVVYRAKDLLMRRTVAIKMLLPETVSNEYALARFQKEAQAAGSLNHPNILTIFDFGISDKKQPYLVMDYAKGHTLADLLETEGYMHLQNGLSVFIQIASALSHAHQKGVIHRDLKPANIMLVEYEGQGDFVKIVDFGIAKTLTREDGQSVELTQTGQVFGSPLYMSPEQCRGTHLDARSDIYSIGCVMYRAVSGSSPFLGHDALELMFKHVNEKPASFSDICPQLKIPKNFEDVVMKCLAKDPNNRYQTMLELRKDLEGVAGFSINSPFIFPATEIDNTKTPKIGSLDEQRSTLNEIIAQSESQKQKADEVAAAQEKLLKDQGELEGTSTPVASAEVNGAAESTAPTAKVVKPASTNSKLIAASFLGALAENATANTGEAKIPGSDITGTVGTPVNTAATAAPTVSPEKLSAQTPGALAQTTSAAEAPSAIASSVSSAGAAPAHQMYNAVKVSENAISAPLAKHSEEHKLMYVVVAVCTVIIVPLGILLYNQFNEHKPSESMTGANPQPAGAATATKAAETEDLAKGRDLFEHGKYVDAHDSLTRAFSLATLNKNTSEKFESLVLLGQIDAARGNVDGARSKFYAVTSGYNSTDKIDKPTLEEAATALNGLGVLATNQGQYSRAHDHFKEALKIREKLPPKDSDLSETLTSLGMLALYEQHYKQALDYFTNAKKLSEQVNGSDHVDTANILNNMGQAYQFLGKYTDADTAYKQALAIRKKKLSPDDPAIASSEMCMAALAFKKRDFQTSEQLFLDALGIDSKALGTDNLAVSQIYFSLGILYQEQKKFSQAAEYYEKALNIQKRKLDPASAKTKHTQALLNEVKKKIR